MPMRSAMLRKRFDIGVDAVLDVAAGGQGAAAAAGEDDRQVVVACGGCRRRCRCRRRSSSCAAASCRRRPVVVEPLQEAGELADVPEVDVGDLVDPLLRGSGGATRSWCPSEMPIWSNERLLPSWASSRVATRVESVWKARTSMSNIRPMYSAKSAGTPAGVSTPGSAAVPNRSAFSIRASISRTPVRYWSSLLAVVRAEPPLHRAGLVEDEVEDRPLLLAAAFEVRRAARRARPRRRGARRPAGGSTRAPSASSASSRRGCTGRRRSSPSRRRPTSGPASQESSSEGNRVRWPIRRAITWSIETPARMSVALLFRRTPVRKVPLPRAWSPAPSGPPSAVVVVEPAARPGRGRGPAPAAPASAEREVAARRRSGHQADGDRAVGEVDEGRPQRGADGGRRQRPPAASPGDGEPGSRQRRERGQGDARPDAAEEAAAAQAARRSAATVGRVVAIRSRRHGRLRVRWSSGRSAGRRRRSGRRSCGRRRPLERGGLDDPQDQGRRRRPPVDSSRSTSRSTASTSWYSRPRPRA